MDVRVDCFGTLALCGLLMTAAGCGDDGVVEGDPSGGTESGDSGGGSSFTSFTNWSGGGDDTGDSTSTGGETDPDSGGDDTTGGSGGDPSSSGSDGGTTGGDGGTTGAVSSGGSTSGGTGGDSADPSTSGDPGTTTGDGSGGTTTGAEPSVCGDDQIQGNEDCDGTDLGGATCDTVSAGFLPQGTLTCLPAPFCGFNAAGCYHCGNLNVEGPEICDDGINDGGYGNCGADCLSVGPYCGDGTTNGPETCDGTDLAGADCTSFGYAAAGDPGDVICAADCSELLDLTCGSTCGNGVVEPDESCDRNAPTVPGDCSSATGGTLTQGAIACASICVYDVSGCYECGNDAIEGPEVCDDTSLAGADCTTLGYANAGNPGDVTCGGDCLGLVDESCAAVCGNNVVEPGEECDNGLANDDNGVCKTDCTQATCGDGFTWNIQGGPEECDNGMANDDAASCTANCLDAVCGDGLIWNTDGGAENCDDGDTDDDDGCSSACLAEFCGDGVINNQLVMPVEICDGTDFGTATCSTETGAARPNGDLSCQTCTGIVSDACYVCGDNAVNGPEICDGTTSIPVGSDCGSLGCTDGPVTTADIGCPATNCLTLNDVMMNCVALGCED